MTSSKAIRRLFRPKTVAVVGGKLAIRAVVRQCDLIGFEGEIFPVNPTGAREMERAAMLWVFGGIARQFPTQHSS